MEEFQLKFDRSISQLEKNNRWKTVVDIVFEQWSANQSDLNALLCAGTQLWYTLLIMDYIQNNPVPPENVEIASCVQLQNNLTKVTRYGFQHFTENSAFNAYFGYMISVMPYLFLDYNGDYLGWQEKGKEMMRHSYELNPNSPFTKAMYYEKTAYEKGTRFFEACKEIWEKITPEQWGDSAVQQYFFRILNGNIFYTDAYFQ